ncbi:hypothetical protein BASA81_007315 [Batrachochytrium salamandrivorans]|nr:hypothetical protein BASA81_007315 [Batrachochytrium salamandrivorans]
MLTEDESTSAPGGDALPPQDIMVLASSEASGPPLASSPPSASPATVSPLPGGGQSQEVFAIRNPNDVPLRDFIPKQMAKISAYVQRLSQPPGAQILAAEGEGNEQEGEEGEGNNQEEANWEEENENGHEGGEEHDNNNNNDDDDEEEERDPDLHVGLTAKPSISMEIKKEPSAAPVLPPAYPPQVRRAAPVAVAPPQTVSAGLAASAVPRQAPFPGQFYPPSAPQHDLNQQYYQQHDLNQQYFQQLQQKQYYQQQQQQQPYYGYYPGTNPAAAAALQQQQYAQYGRPQPPTMMPGYPAGGPQAFVGQYAAPGAMATGGGPQYPTATAMQAYGAATAVPPPYGAVPTQQPQSQPPPPQQQQAHFVQGGNEVPYAMRQQQHLQFGGVKQQYQQQQQQHHPSAPYFLPQQPQSQQQRQPVVASSPHPLVPPSAVPFLSPPALSTIEQQVTKRAKPASEDDSDCTWTSSLSNPPIVEAILHKDVERLRKLLIEIPHPSALDQVRDDAGHTLLMLAAFNGSTESVRMLVACGVDTAAFDSTGYTAAHWAAKYNQWEMLKVIVGASPAAATIQTKQQGDTPLHVACRFEALDCIRGLLTGSDQQLLLAINTDCDTPYDVSSSPTVRMCVLEMCPQIQTLALYHHDCQLAPDSLPSSNTNTSKQESGERLMAVLQALETCKEPGFLLVTDFAKATREQLLLAHEEDYVKFIYDLDASLRSSSTNSNKAIPLTPCLQRGLQQRQVENGEINSAFASTSLPAALRAAGAVIHAVDLVVKESCRNVLCTVRPLGHQASSRGLSQSRTSMGFSVFNSIVIGALHALRPIIPHQKPIRRVLILDFDSEPGFGTQEILMRKYQTQPTLVNQVLYISLNQQSGSEELSSLWDKNIHNWFVNESNLEMVVETKLLPLARAFCPDLILMSSGFYPKDEKETGLLDYQMLTQHVLKLANVCCQGRLVSVLEGGYGTVASLEPLEWDRTGFAKLVSAHALQMAGLVPT